MKQTDGRGMFGKGIKRPVKAAQSQTARRRSADLQSAVSRICNPLVAESIRHLRVFGRLAECNSAIRQSATLRYGAGVPSFSAIAVNRGRSGVWIQELQLHNL